MGEVHVCDKVDELLLYTSDKGQIAAADDAQCDGWCECTMHGTGMYYSTFRLGQVRARLIVNVILCMLYEPTGSLSLSGNYTHAKRHRTPLSTRAGHGVSRRGHGRPSRL